MKGKSCLKNNPDGFRLMLLSLHGVEEKVKCRDAVHWVIIRFDCGYNHSIVQLNRDFMSGGTISDFGFQMWFVRLVKWISWTLKKGGFKCSKSILDHSVLHWNSMGSRLTCQLVHFLIESKSRAAKLILFTDSFAYYLLSWLVVCS